MKFEELELIGETMKKYKLKNGIEFSCSLTGANCVECKFFHESFTGCETLLNLEKIGIDLSQILEEIMPEPIKYDPTWRPENEGKYFMIEDYNTINTVTYDGGIYDTTQFLRGTAYQTEELAEEAKWRNAFHYKMYLEFKPWEVNWENHTQNKSYIAFDNDDNEFVIRCAGFIQHTQIYSTSSKTVKNFISNNKKDLLRYFKNEMRLP